MGRLSIGDECLDGWHGGDGRVRRVGRLLFYGGLSDLSVNFAMSDYGSLPSGPYPRIRALFVNPNMLCNYLNVSLVFILTMDALGWLTGGRSRLLLMGTWMTAFFALSPGFGGLLLASGGWLWARGHVAAEA